MLYRQTARRIFLEALDRIEVGKVLRSHVRCAEGILRIGAAEYPLNAFRGVGVVSLGKAAVPMAKALLQVLGPELTPGQMLDGIVVGATAATCPGLRCVLGGHPIPDERSLAAADEALRFVSGLGSGWLLVFLISGGASAMVEKPLDPAMTVEDTARFYRALVHSGLRIQEINVLRKHFSALKGGRLAVAAGEATQSTLLVADVPSGSLDVIGSGPTLPDPSTVRSCRDILAAHPRDLQFPGKVMRFFENSALPETPKADHPAFSRSSAMILLSSEELCAEAALLARREGFHTVIDNSCDEWKYDDAAQYLLERMAALRRQHGRVCLLSAGEIVVKVEGEQGAGGRNQHFALACARRMAESGQRVTVLSAGTDGVDGNSTAAGAVADETTWARARALGLNVDAALAKFDSNTLLHALGDTIVTGPSGNNVRDLRILLSGE